MCIHTHARSCFQIWVMHIYRVHVQKNNNFLIHIYVTRSREMSRMSTIFNFEISTPLSGNSRMLHFNANLIIIWYLVTELWVIRWKQYKTKEFECFLCLYLKNNICDIRLIPLDHVTYEPHFVPNSSKQKYNSPYLIGMHSCASAIQVSPSRIV